MKRIDWKRHNDCRNQVADTMGLVFAGSYPAAALSGLSFANIYVVNRI